MNIFIVEDEYWSLKEMETLFKKYESMHTIYAFESGDDAYAHMHKVIPELILTDITMPRMNGLELIKKAKALNPSVETIILTVHDTFDYAKEGIHLGITDYLLKPIKKDKLFEVTDKVIANIEIEQKRQYEKENWMINQLLFTSMTETSDPIDISLNPCFFIYVLMGNWETQLKENDVLKKPDLNQMMYELGLPAKQLRLVHIDMRRQVILLPNKDIGHIEKSVLPTLFKYLNQKIHVHMCYLNKGKNMTLKQAFQLAHETLTKHKLFGYPTLIDAVNPPVTEVNLHSIWEIIRFIELTIEKGEQDQLRCYIRQVIEKLIDLSPSQQQLQRFLIDLNYAILYNLRQKKMMTLDLDTMQQDFDFLNYNVAYSELEKWLQDYFYKLTDTFSSKNIAAKQLIPKIQQWIEQDYAKHITFSEFSKAHHVSLSYLSKEFKRQTGVTFVDYLTEVRIRKALELFEAGKERTVEVGELVGYHDPKYFRSVFKKMTGMSPKAYKEKVTSY